MLRVTNMADYAVVILVHAAAHSAVRLSAASTAQATGIPAPTVAKILSALARAGLVVSHRGAAGGYGLARPEAAISVADIIEAVDGPIALTSCTEGSGACEREGTCQMRDPWQQINRTVRRSLETISLAALASPAFTLRRQLEPAHG